MIGARVDADSGPPGRIWRARALLRVYRLLTLIALGALPFYGTLGERVEGAARIAVLFAGARFAGDHRRLRAWTVALGALLLELGASSFLRIGATPDAMVAAASAVLLLLVFAGEAIAAIFFAAALALLIACAELFASGRLAAPVAASFAGAEDWVRFGAGLLLFAVVLAYATSTLLRQFERGLTARREAIDQRQLERAGWATAEANRQLPASVLFRVREHELQGRRAAGIAHDLNNMMVVVLSWATALETSTLAEGEIAEAAESIVVASERATSLARQLESLGGVEDDVRGPTDLAALGAELVRDLRRLFRESVDVVEGTFDPAPTLGSPAQLQQVLLNFGLNAADAMPAGGRIAISSGPASAAEADGLQVPAVAVRVRDTGSGMDAQTRARLFEPFFTTKRGGQGVGMGLAAALSIVKAHCGRIHVETEPERGSTFALVLPRAAAHHSPKVARISQIPARGTVLLVEDDAAVRGAMAHTLSRAGLEVLEAKDGNAAVERASSGARIDLLCIGDVLADMPALRAIEAVTDLQSRVRVLVCSGGVAPDAGGFAILRKPFGAAALLDEIASVMSDVFRGGIA